MRSEIDLHIENLILHGFNPGDRYQIKDAVEMELSRLINNRGLKNNLTGEINLPRINGGDIQIRQHMSAETTGRAIAHSVYGTINENLCVNNNSNMTRENIL